MLRSYLIFRDYLKYFEYLIPELMPLFLIQIKSYKSPGASFLLLDVTCCHLRAIFKGFDVPELMPNIFVYIN
jgi:hypothetical protein